METFDTFFEGDAVAFALKRHIPHGKKSKKLSLFSKNGEAIFHFMRARPRARA